MIRHGWVRAGSASLTTTGALAIALGLAVYALSRPVRIPLVPSALHLAHARHESALFGSVPSALHAFAMPLLTLACFRNFRRWHALAACASWSAIDVLFELAQRTSSSFFPGGTFDPLDVLAVIVGAALAYAVASAVTRSKS
jgi:hypothetical protein